MNKIIDLIIIGAGPSGLSASIYASRYGISHEIYGKILGGQISETHHIDNYPGMEDMSGFEFSQKWGHHVEKYGIKINPMGITNIDKKDDVFELELENKKIVKTKAILLATGTKRRKLGITSEEAFSGKGVSYCATCDGFFYRGKTVAVVGGSDSAAGAALYLAGICEKVYVVYRKETLRCEPYWTKMIEENEKIEVVYGANISEIAGSDKVEKIILDKDWKESREIAVDGVFIEVGSDPEFSFAKNLSLDIDEGGYIKINKDCSTNVPGAWAAGDITDGSDKFRQVVTAAAEGAIAARSIFNWLKKG